MKPRSTRAKPNSMVQVAAMYRPTVDTAVPTSGACARFRPAAWGRWNRGGGFLFRVARRLPRLRKAFRPRRGGRCISDSAKLTSEAIHLVYQLSCNHGHHDLGGFSAASTHARRHAHAQAGTQAPGSLHPRRPQAGRLPQARAGHRHGRRPAQFPAAPGGHGHLPRHAQRDADRAKVLLRLHLAAAN